jgi:hypothetical protein
MVARIVDFYSYLRCGERRVAFQRSPTLSCGKAFKCQDSALRSKLRSFSPEPIPPSVSPSSSLRIDVIVGTPSDVLVGCVRPAPQQC